MIYDNPQKLELIHSYLCKKTGSEEVEVRFLLDSVMGEVGVDTVIKTWETLDSEWKEYEKNVLQKS